MGPQRNNFFTTLEKHVPANSIHYCYDLWIKYPFNLKITRARNTKLGDYRYNPKNKNHYITVNHNLNPYNFLITYIHEIAHLLAHVLHGKGIKPHGEEWKACFQELINPMLSDLVFPVEVLLPLNRYMQNPAASSCTDMDLYKALRAFDQQSHHMMLSEILPGERFVFNKRVFEKENVRRTKAMCREISTGKKYLIPQLAMVTRLEDPSTSMKSCG
jgi:SprT protein